MGAPHWGQNLLSDTAPQMGQVLVAGRACAGSAASSLMGLLASSSAIFVLEAMVREMIRYGQPLEKYLPAAAAEQVRKIREETNREEARN